MLINFTDKRYYVKGTCLAIATDKATNDIVYYSNKFQVGNIQTSVNMDVIRAGMGNSVANILPSDSDLKVTFTAADFNLWAKAAQVGATLSYGAPDMVCQTVQAQAGALKISLEQGTPVAQLGQSKIVCYVQVVGEAAPIATTGAAYSLDAETGTVEGFTAQAGVTYKVWYFISRATAQAATISSLFNPKTVHFSAQLPVFSNQPGAAKNEGSRVGWLYVIVPSLKLGGDANITGDQSNADTTSLSGQAVAYDADVVSESCESCGAAGSVLAYYVFVLDDGSQSVAGLAVVGGVTTVKAGTSQQLEVRMVMDNGQLVKPGSYSEGFTYALETPPDGTTISAAGVITAGTAAGDCDCTITYKQGEKTVQTESVVSVVSA